MIFIYHGYNMIRVAWYVLEGSKVDTLNFNSGEAPLPWVWVEAMEGLKAPKDGGDQTGVALTRCLQVAWDQGSLPPAAGSSWFPDGLHWRRHYPCSYCCSSAFGRIRDYILVDSPH